MTISFLSLAHVDTRYPSIFSEDDDVYNSDPLHGSQTPAALARKARHSADTAISTPVARRTASLKLSVA